MTYLPFWLCGAVLAGVPLVHWLVLHRAVAVSGRYTVLVDRLRRFGTKVDAAPELTEAQAIALVQAMTAEAFGEAAVDPAPQEDAPTGAASSRPAFQAPDGARVSVGFLLGLVLGGGLSAALAGHAHPAFALRGALFAGFFGSSPIAAAGVLFSGGLLVGVGTRMSGGCTSGHGLCGVSQLQKGSLLATASFFGAGVVTSLLLRAFG